MNDKRVWLTILQVKCLELEEVLEEQGLNEEEIEEKVDNCI